MSALGSVVPSPPLPSPGSTGRTCSTSGASGLIYGFSLSGLNLANALASAANCLL